MAQPAAKQGDKVIATDTHILLIPRGYTTYPFASTLEHCTDVNIEGKPEIAQFLLQTRSISNIFS